MTMPSQLLSLVLFGEGLITGLTLTAMVGPVTLTILRYGMQVNKFAGLWTAIGTWVSDILFIAFTYWLTTSINEFIKKPDIRFWVFIICGISLIIIGLLMLKRSGPSSAESQKSLSKNYLQAFIAGFLVNTLSPFSLIFWIGAAIFLHMQSDNAMWYYGGLMLSLATGDFLKAWLAPRLTSWLKEKYVHWVQVIAGVLIGVTGLFLIGYALLK